MSLENVFIVIVALGTWGGVFFTILRVEALAKRLERRVELLEDEALEDDAVSEPAPLEEQPLER